MRSWIDAARFHSSSQVASIGQPRHGIVSSVDPANHAVKVTIEPDGIETGWIPDAAIAAGGLKIACPSEVGTQVLLVSVEGDAEHPVVVGKLFDTVITPPVSPATGQVVQAGEVGFFVSNSVYVHLTSDGIYLAGKVKINGSLNVSGDVVSDTVSLQQHIHSAVQAGDDVSGPPRT